MTELEQQLAARLIRRFDRYMTEFEATGSEASLAIATEADRVYRRLINRP